MAKYSCNCGYVMNLSKGWEDYELTLIPEKTIEKIGGILNNNDKLSENDFLDMIDEGRIGVYRCPHCGRLHLESKPGVFTTYIKEG